MTLVNAHGAHVQVRSPWSVFLLGMVTLGFYWCYWCWKVHTEMRAYADQLGPSAPRELQFDAATEAVKFTVAYIIAVILAFAGLALIGSIPVWYLYVQGKNRIRSCQLVGGMAPEHTIGGTSFWVLWFLGLCSWTMQDELNRLWRQYPELYGTHGAATPRPDALAGAATTPAGVASPLPGSVYPVPAAQSPASALPAPAAPLPTASPQQVIAALSPKAADGSISDGESWELAEAVHALHGSTHSRPWYTYLLGRQPHHAGAHLRLGGCMLELGDPAGADHVRFAMQADPTLAAEAQRLLAVASPPAALPPHGAQAA